MTTGWVGTGGSAGSTGLLTNRTPSRSRSRRSTTWGTGLPGQDHRSRDLGPTSVTARASRSGGIVRERPAPDRGNRSVADAGRAEPRARRRGQAFGTDLVRGRSRSVESQPPGDLRELGVRLPARDAGTVVHRAAWPRAESGARPAGPLPSPAGRGRGPAAGTSAGRAGSTRTAGTLATRRRPTATHGSADHPAEQATGAGGRRRAQSQRGLGEATRRHLGRVSGPQRQALEMGDRAGLDERQQPQESPRCERGQQQQRRASQYVGEAAAGRTARRRARAPGPERARGQTQHRDDHELAEDEGDEGVDQSPTPVRDRRPRQAGQRQREEEHGNVDGGGPEQQLDPHQERSDHDGDTPQEDDERRHSGLARRSAERIDDGRHEVARVEARTLRHRRRQRVRQCQTELHELDRRRREQDGQGHVDQYRPQQRREVLAVDRLDDAEEEERHDDDPAERGHRLVVLGEPRGAEVDRRGGGQDGADLVEQPHRSLCHPVAQRAEHRVHADARHL